MSRHTNTSSTSFPTSRVPTSRVDVAIVASIVAALAVCLLGFSGNGSGLARAGVAFDAYETDMGRFPVRGKTSTYDSTGGVDYPGASVPIELVALQLVSSDGLDNSVALPAAGSTVNVSSFFDVFTEISVDGGSSFNVDSFFDTKINFRISGVTDGTKAGSWDTEILSMDLKGAIPGPTGELPFALRESPTLPSLGKHTLTTLDDGTFRIDSFFDVWTEISLDGGGSFHPAKSPLQLELTRLVPEPASMVMVVLGLAGAGALARRRRSC